MTDLAVTAMGADQPGIIAALAEVLRDHDANIGEVAMTSLSGHLAVVLQVTTELTPADLRSALLDGTTDLALAIGVGPATSDRPTPTVTHVLSVYGTDQPGLLARVARAVADVDADVVDLRSSVLDPADPTEAATWAMSVELAASAPGELLATALDDVCGRLEVDHRLHRVHGDTT